MIHFEDENIEQDTAEIEYEIEVIHYTKQSLQYGAYQHMHTYLQFFEKVQHKFRKLALTWLLAAFAGMGFLISAEESGLPFDSLLWVTMLSFAGIIGIMLVWYMDMSVYQKLKYALLIEMVKLEEKHKWLPALGSHFLCMHNETKTRFYEGFFYVGCTIILYFIGSVAVVRLLTHFGFWMQASISLVLLGIAAFLIYFIVKEGDENIIVHIEQFK